MGKYDEITHVVYLMFCWVNLCAWDDEYETSTVVYKYERILRKMGLVTEGAQLINGVINMDIFMEIRLSSCAIPCIALLDLNVFYVFC